MSVHTVTYVLIRCNRCDFESQPQHDQTIQEVEARAVYYGWESCSPGAPILSEAKHLCPFCAREPR